jgi:hypothetical protein
MKMIIKEILKKHKKNFFFKNPKEKKMLALWLQNM